MVIKLNIEANAATVELNRPPVNAINQDWIDRMDQILDQVEDREDLSVLHIRSSSGTFCAGADLALMRGLVTTSDGCDAMVGLIRRYQRVLERLEKIGLVTVAELGGAAVGGGLELALACDLRIACRSARIGFPEAGLGLIPGAGGTQRLTRLCGESVARRIILGAEVVDGEQAEKLGVVQWVFPDEELISAAGGIVKRLGSLPRQALSACKRCIDASYDAQLDGYEQELLETRTLYGNADTRKRLQDFLGQ